MGTLSRSRSSAQAPDQTPTLLGFGAGSGVGGGELFSVETEYWKIYSKYLFKDLTTSRSVRVSPLIS